MIKKIFTGILILFLFILTGCDSGKMEHRNLRSEINEMIEKYPHKKDELEALRKDLYDNPSRVYLIAKRVQTLKQIYEGIYDGFLIVKIIDLTNEIIKDDEILYRNNELLWDILKRNYNVVFEEEESLINLKSIGGSFIDNNYRLKFYLNSELYNDFGMIPYQYGDMITIRNENWNGLEQVDLMVDQAIYKFIRNQISRYFIKAPALDPFVVNGIKALEKVDNNIVLKDFASNIKYEEYFNKKVYDTNSNTYVNNLLKDIIIMNAFDLDTTNQIMRLNSIINNLTNIQKINSLLSLGVINTPIEQVRSLLDIINRFEPSDTDVDNVSLALAALANYPNYQHYAQNINRFSNYLALKMTPLGIDLHGANCISTSNAIIALTSNNLNPRGNMFKARGVDLIEALLKYEQNGAFKWTENSGIDLTFSTPQGWAALVAYKIFRER